MATVDITISASNQDSAQTGATNNIAITNVNLDGDNEEILGFLFVTSAVPQGATISAAYITFHFDDGTLDEPNVDIWGHKVASSGVFTNTDNDLLGRVTNNPTTATVNWSNTNLGAPGSFQTPSLVSIVQEIVDQVGYTANFCFILQAAGTTNRDFGPTQYDDAAGVNAATLHIEYTGGGGGGGGAGTASLLLGMMMEQDQGE